MKRTIIGIVGESGSGKSTVAKYICEKYGATSFRFSDMLRDILNRLYISETRDNLQDLSTALRQTFGEDIMSKALVQDMKKSDASLIITEGIRRPSDVANLKTLHGFTLIALKADAEKRFNLMHTRNEKTDDRTRTWEEFKNEANHEAEQKIKEIMAEAHYTIYNTGTKEELFAQIDELINVVSNKQ